MNNAQQSHFNMLRGEECVPTSYVQAYYGLTWPLPDGASDAFQQYHNSLPCSKQCSDDSVSRYELEGFISRANLLPHKWMAARLGMKEESLDKVLNGLGKLGMQQKRYVVLPGFVAESLAEDIIRFLPDMRFRIFADHDSYCERLHGELGEALDIRVEALFCATSDHLQDNPRRFAMYFDCLTLEPVSTRYSVWLDFHKPLYLPPDRCSKLFYAKNRGELGQFIMGGEPEDVDKYEAFLKRGDHV